MDTSQKPALPARLMMPVQTIGVSPSAGSSVRGRLVAIGAAIVIYAIVSPWVSMGSPWFVIAMLLAAVPFHTLPADWLIAGSGPQVALVSAMLGDQARGIVIHRASTTSDAAQVIQSEPVGTVIVGESLDADLLGDIEGFRGGKPLVVDAGDAVEELLGRIPVSRLNAERMRAAVAAQSPAYHAIRRVIDIVFALSLGLVTLLLLPLIALAIRLDSPGSVFYSQERVGLNGATFPIYKFRSMRSDAERHGAVWAEAGDARVTRVGRFLRLSRLDELPQLWNVLRGDMTLVGPRPERPVFTAMLEQEIPGYTLRTLVKPGLTGWAQVAYQYTNSVAETRTKLEYDMFYVKNASLRFDFRILVRTIAVVVNMRGR